MAWGGVDFDVVPPPPREQPAAEGASAEASPETIALPTAAVLFVARAGGGGARLRPVAELAEDGLRPLGLEPLPEEYWRRFVTEFMRQGSEFSLYRAGRRAGTFVLDGASPSGDGACAATATATGGLELAAGVERAGDFLALAEGTLPPQTGVGRDSAAAAALRARGRRVGPILAERLLRARGAGLPGNWQAALVQAQAFPSPDGGDGLVATLLVGDTLGPGLDDLGFALFYLATPSADRSGIGLDTVFTAFWDYPQTGKTAPRVLGYLDWDRDGWPGFVLEVFDTSSSRLETLQRDESGQWATAPLLDCTP
ncbi:MAG: hypothetical protein ABFS34_02325 [Gemmatimonadota bacterium]